MDHAGTSDSGPFMVDVAEVGIRRPRPRRPPTPHCGHRLGSMQQRSSQESVHPWERATNNFPIIDHGGWAFQPALFHAWGCVCGGQESPPSGITKSGSYFSEVLEATTPKLGLPRFRISSVGKILGRHALRTLKYTQRTTRLDKNLVVRISGW